MKESEQNRGEITEEDIRIRAYLLWEQAGRPHGRDKDFWAQAERELQEMAQSY